MLIASWPLHDFAGFLQIISWITLPVLIVAVAITILMHYYQRSKKKRDEEGVNGKFVHEPSIPQERSSYHQARYQALKNDFEALQQMYRANEGELTMLSAEMRRQDHVIDQLRSDVASLEKHLLNLRLALQLKEEQLHSVAQLLEEKQSLSRTTA